MTKTELLTELCSNTFVMLKPSPFKGIGVFAIQYISKGCREMFSKPDALDKWITLSKDEVGQLPLHAQQMVENYCLFDAESYFVPDYGFKKIDVSLFLNHSDAPNIISINDGEFFEATRDIGIDEELLIDYSWIVSES
ncbi:MAG: SET domain-containing protein [Bacteroidia bacterium]|nr:SET domain-containing protein [Bacteroidia bacterium]